MRLPAIMIAVAALALDFSGPVAPDPHAFQFVRTVEIAAGAPSVACAVLDAGVYQHSLRLVDLRLLAGNVQVPYALSTSQTEPAADTARVLNSGLKHGHIAFDLEMPQRPYSRIDLQLSGENFLAAATVTGLSKPEPTNGTQLGTFTLFDLAGQHLGRSTAIQLGESTFPFLHIDLAFSTPPGADAFHPEPAMVEGAAIPPSREAQTLYTTVAESSQIVQKGRETIATFRLPAHVPVERISFETAPGDKTNFSRSVAIRASAISSAESAREQPPAREEVDGEISRVRVTEAGREIREQSLDVPAVLGSNGQTDATVEVAVANGDDRPLNLKTIWLQMRQRKLCFDVPATPVKLYYADPRLQQPVYDYERLFDVNTPSRSAQLGSEQRNPDFIAQVESKSFSERYPWVLWIALLAVVGALGLVALRSGKTVGR